MTSHPQGFFALEGLLSELVGQVCARPFGPNLKQDWARALQLELNHLGDTNNSASFSRPRSGRLGVTGLSLQQLKLLGFHPNCNFKRSQTGTLKKPLLVFRICPPRKTGGDQTRRLPGAKSRLGLPLTGPRPPSTPPSRRSPLEPSRASCPQAAREPRPNLGPPARSTPRSLRRTCLLIKTRY